MPPLAPPPDAHVLSSCVARLLQVRPGVTLGLYGSKTRRTTVSAPGCYSLWCIAHSGLHLGLRSCITGGVVLTAAEADSLQCGHRCIRLSNQLRPVHP